MPEIGLINIATFFVIIGACLIFVAAWIIKSESRINICKEEISRLKNQTVSLDREKSGLLEKLSSQETAPIGPSGYQSSNRELKEAHKNNESLEAENKKLKRELSEAKKSLEEVYRALSA